MKCLSLELGVLSVVLLGAGHVDAVGVDTRGIAEVSRPSAVFNPATGHWYELLDPATWTEAEANAVALGQSYGQGYSGHLVTINNQEEQDWLVTTFGSGRAWIGYNDVQQEDNWVWTSGENPEYENWVVIGGQPDGDTVENWAVMNWDPGSTAWNDWGPTKPDYHDTRGIAEIVPEPSSAALLTACAACTAAYACRKARCRGRVQLPVLRRLWRKCCR